MRVLVRRRKREGHSRSDRQSSSGSEPGLTSVLVEVRQRLLIGEEEALILGDDLPPQVLPAGRQLAQFLQLTHPEDTQTRWRTCEPQIYPEKHLQQLRGPETNIRHILSHFRSQQIFSVTPGARHVVEEAPPPFYVTQPTETQPVQTYSVQFTPKHILIGLYVKILICFLPLSRTIGVK